MTDESVVILSPHENRKAKGRAYYQRHRAERLAYGKRYYAQNREQALAYYYAKKDATHHIRSLSDDEQVIQKKRLYAKKRYNRLKDDQNYIKKRTQKDKKYRIYNKEKLRIYARLKREYIKQFIINDLTNDQWIEIVITYKYRCVYCDKKFKLESLTRDHLTPIARGGHHTVSNIVPACLSCNARKGARGVLKPVQPLLFTLA